MLGGLFIALGLAISVWGVRTVVKRPRPASLAGSVVGAAGLALAFLGALKLVVPKLF